MDFGIFYEIQVKSPFKVPENEHRVFHQVMDQAVRAEQAGFDSFWSVEHHFQPGFSHSSAPEVLYGAISQRTSTLRLGHGVVLLPFPYNHPVRVAERIATLDIISNGRVEFGTGRSITPQELGGFGIPFEETMPRWREALEVITEIWKSEDGTFSFKGDYFDIPERQVVPRPVQKPHPPIWNAGTSAKSHVLSGELGLGALLFTVLVEPDEVGRRAASYREAVRDANGPGAFVNDRVGGTAMVHCADTDQAAEEEAEASFMTYVMTTLQSTQPVILARTSGRTVEEVIASGDEVAVAEYEGVDPRDVNLQFMIEKGMCICGDPDTCIKQIERVQDAVGFDLFLCMMQYWGIPHEKTMHAIDLFGEHVIPYFKKKYG